MGKWFLCIETPKKKRIWSTHDTPDEVADTIIEVVNEWNKDTKKKYGAMDFEDRFFIFMPLTSGGYARVLIEDLPCYCSSEWIVNNSVPAVLS